MLKPIDAVRVAMNKIDNFVASTLYDYGDYYVVENVIPFDTADMSYKIDKQTGAISEFSFVEYTKAIKQFGDDDDPLEYSISELLKAEERAS